MDGAPSRPGSSHRLQRERHRQGQRARSEEPGRPGGAELEELGADQQRSRHSPGPPQQTSDRTRRRVPRRPTGQPVADQDQHRGPDRQHPGELGAAEIARVAPPGVQGSSIAGRRTDSSVSTTSNHSSGIRRAAAWWRTSGPTAAPSQAQQAGRQQPPATKRTSVASTVSRDVAGGKTRPAATTRNSSAPGGPHQRCRDELREHQPSPAGGGQQRRGPGGVVELAGAVTTPSRVITKTPRPLVPRTSSVSWRLPGAGPPPGPRRRGEARPGPAPAAPRPRRDPRLLGSSTA